MKSVNALVLVLGSLAQSCHTAALAASIDEAAYAVPHTLVDVGGGRRLNLYCSGHGEPSVIFDAGAGLAGWDWLLVHPALAAITRACVYDRAGLGFSDPARRPGTSAFAVDDLHRLLRGAGVAPPYVLVGHSYGGANVQLYAYTYPQEVAGLVLVDASHEDETARLDRITAGKFSQLVAEERAGEKECVATARQGFTAGTEAFARCIGAPPPMFGPALAAVFTARQMRAATWDAMESEASNEAVSDAQLRQARQSFGALPLIYLTHGISPYQVPGQPQSEMNRAAERDTVRLHDEVARLSSRGSQRVVAGAGHSIHIDRPQAVIEAIEAVLEQAGTQPEARR